MAEDRPLVNVPPFCYRHRYKLVQAAKYSPTDPWRALEVMANIAMFQGALATQSVWKKIDGDVTRIQELGCLACRLPGKFELVLRAAAKQELGEIKKLGESWVKTAGTGVSTEKGGEDSAK